VDLELNLEFKSNSLKTPIWSYKVFLIEINTKELISNNSIKKLPVIQVFFRSRSFLYFGYSNNHEGYLCFISVMYHLYSCKHVRFDEKVHNHHFYIYLLLILWLTLLYKCLVRSIPTNSINNVLATSTTPA